MEGVVQPSGTVTLVFTDVEGSTRLLAELGHNAYRDALAGHRHAVRDAFGRHGGYEVDNQGDSFFFAFASAPDGVQAVSDALQALEPGPLRIRVGLHTGTPVLDPPKYVGLEVHKAARIMAAAHGGQVLVSRATRELLDGSLPLRDLGEHKLKDFDRAEHLFQLGERAFPPLRTISNTNLPRPASSFVGRDRELAEVTGLLDSGTRLVTLTGPGGTGKTRLAIEAASALVERFRSGVVWVELAAVRDSDLVLPAISQVVGARVGLAEHVGDREQLIVLDNLEQVIDVGPELASLIEACPNLCLLVTSRERLAVRAEAELEVPPLPDDDAVALFTTRSRVEPTPEAEELCRRLDNIPLALELAAARTKSLDPPQILERLGRRLDLLTGGRDADPRQRSLRATIEWSYDLLEPDEQRLFARLAVFTGGCTLEAADDVCDADLDTLGSLVEKSLVRHSRGRYWMLETIRVYALERLEESGEGETLAGRHAGWILELAERFDTLLVTVRNDEEADPVDAEHENGRLALQYLLDRDPATALRLASALAVVWARRGRSTEGSLLLANAIAAAPGAEPEVLAKAHYRAGSLLLSASLLDDARVSFKDALALFATAGDRIGVVLSTTNLGSIALDQGDLDAALGLATAALDEARVLDEPTALWYATCLAGNLNQERGNVRSGTALHLEAVRQAQETGHPFPVTVARGGLGWNELVCEDFAGARATFREYLAHTSPRNTLERASALCNLGWAELCLANTDEARARFSESLLLAAEVRWTALAAEILTAVAAMRAEQGAAAATLWGAAQGLRAESGTQPTTFELRVEERWLETLRNEHRAEYDLGTTLGLDEAVELALKWAVKDSNLRPWD
jgi:predicted ATPase/class 3 adenylate cyclase